METKRMRSLTLNIILRFLYVQVDTIASTERMKMETPFIDFSLALEQRALKGNEQDFFFNAGTKEFIVDP